jgi:1,4-alpha-glucan branching enzyme
VSYPFQRPLGATTRPEGGVEFRVWAPRPGSVAVDGHDLEPAGYGIWEAVVDAEPGGD